MAPTPKQRTVAVVGTGLAGLTIAHLLNTDPNERYNVQVFEIGARASLDAASLSMAHPHGKSVDRIDVPMRALSEGYYPNLKAMYDFLRIDYHRQRLVFAFSADASPPMATSGSSSRISASPPSTYFIHASNLHLFPPLRPQDASVLEYLYELVFVGGCFLWFSLCCFVFQARDHEALGAYLQRVHMPWRFVSLYVLPLLSAICTCSHEDLLQFPARDIVNYRKSIFGGEQFVVTKGVGQIEQKLLPGLNIVYNAKVTYVEAIASQKLVSWEQYDENGQRSAMNRRFDVVVLAVPPDVVARIFKPASTLAGVPTVSVRTVAHSDRGRIFQLQNDHAPVDRIQNAMGQLILLHTNKPKGLTEATHIHNSGTMVTTVALSSIDSAHIHGDYTFTRVLRTVKSRNIVDSLLQHKQSSDRKWVNGDMEVWLVGAWCWDGMVLLEGCVVSAMKAARDLGVRAPWTLGI